MPWIRTPGASSARARRPSGLLGPAGMLGGILAAQGVPGLIHTGWSSFATIPHRPIGVEYGAVAVATHHEFVLAIVGGLFVVEALSVVIQVAVYKRTGKRVFLMAPIHHHFEHLGWSEPTVVIRFWIISFVLALAGLATLKLR